MTGSRLLLQESIHDKFVDKLVALARTAKMGDPSNMDTQVGPVTTRPQYQKVLSYIETAKHVHGSLNPLSFELVHRWARPSRLGRSHLTPPALRSHPYHSSV